MPALGCERRSLGGAIGRCVVRRDGRLIRLEVPLPPRLIDRDDLLADFFGLLSAREHAEKQGLLFV